jgi:hypothetical protein
MVSDRFWAKVPDRPDEGCWLWHGALTAKGYGKIYVDGRYLSAHRVAVALDGRTIPPGMIAMHICDTPACVRPSHLVVGTYSDNHRDSVRKGRWNIEGRWRGLRQRHLTELERAVLDGQ